MVWKFRHLSRKCSENAFVGKYDPLLTFEYMLHRIWLCFTSLSIDSRKSAIR